MGGIATDIPIELLGKIFHLLCLKPIHIAQLRNFQHLNDFPWAVGLVCKHWRHAFVSFPALWASLSLHDSQNSVAYHREMIRRLGTYLERSGEHPLTVAVDYRRPRDPLIQAWRMLLSHSRRWKSANLELGEMSQVDDLRSCKGKMNLVEGMRLSVPFGFPKACRTFDAAPCLTRVTLPYWGGMNSWILPWAQMTKVIIQLNRTELLVDGDVADMLHMLKSVEEMHFVLSCQPDNGNLVLPQRPPSPLNHLLLLKVPHPSILSWIETPLLYELHIMNTNFSPEGSFSEAVTSLIRRSSCKIRRLMISEIQDPDIPPIMNALSDLENLHIINTLYSLNCCSISTMLGVTQFDHLPRLRLLTIICDPASLILPRFVKELARLLEARTHHVQSNVPIKLPEGIVPLEKVTLRLFYAREVPREVSDTVRRWPTIVDVDVHFLGR